MFAKSSVTVIAGILLLSALTGCTNTSEEVSQKMSPSPSETSTPTPTEDEAQPLTSVLDYTQPIVLAKDDLELEFLTIAVNSCKKAQTHGFVAKTSSGESYFRPTETGRFPNWPFLEVSVISGNTVVGDSTLFSNYWPANLNPCDLEAAARSRLLEESYWEHKVRKIDDNTYGWAQHGGGANLDEIIYEVQDGLVSAYGANEPYAAEITYGPLSDYQNSLLDQAKK
jgi:hypothetical protein